MGTNTAGLIDSAHVIRIKSNDTPYSSTVSRCVCVCSEFDKFREKPNAEAVLSCKQNNSAVCDDVMMRSIALEVSYNNSSRATAVYFDVDQDKTS